MHAMQEGKLKIRPTAVLTIAAGDVRTLLEAGNGDAALLYLHILNNGGTLDIERAATELHRSDRDIEIVAGRLRSMGLLTAEGESAPVLEPPRELPQYRASEVASRSMESEEFKQLVDGVQTHLGRLLSSADIKKLFGLYDELHLPVDVIMLLIQYCKQVSEERYGKERTVGFGFIEKEAYVWVNRNITTYEQAEQWLAEQEQRRSCLGQLQRVLGIRDRTLSKTEREYLLSWLELGFSVEAIAIAYDRTVTKTHGLQWKYMDKIIRSWDSMGLHTPEEIEAGDPFGGTRKRVSAQTEGAESDVGTALDQMARIRSKMKNGNA